MIVYTVPEAGLSLIPIDYNNNYHLFILYKVKVSFQKVKSHGITNDSTVNYSLKTVLLLFIEIKASYSCVKCS